jgi:hypothetical protein
VLIASSENAYRFFRKRLSARPNAPPSREREWRAARFRAKRALFALKEFAKQSSAFSSAQQMRQEEQRPFSRKDE